VSTEQRSTDGATTQRAKGGAKRLTRDDWTAAALTALTSGGVQAVAVEPLAASLGSTKGSFYHHFADRDELLRCALERWERTETDAVIDFLRPLPTARERLSTLVRTIFAHSEGELSVRLAGSAAHPAVAPVLARVTRRRVDYVAEQLAETGLAPDVAHRRAVLAYAAYVGWSQLRPADPQHGLAGAEPAEVRLYADEMLGMLLP
jgi:AcrR family transcriptional regulator